MLGYEKSPGKRVQVKTLGQVFFQKVGEPSSSSDSPGAPIKHAVL